MKKIAMSVLSLSLMLSAQSKAADQVQTLVGKGIDGKPCAVKVVREGELLKSVTLEGSAKVFEILAENGGSYGPRTEVRERGAREIFNLMEEGNKGLYQFFTHSNNLFSNGEVFKLDTNDIPQNGEEGLKGVKMIIQLGLNYDGQELVSVKAQSKAKALLVATLASSQFTCDKE